MRRTMAKVYHNGTYRVVHDSEAYINPYTIYHEVRDGGFHSHKVASYQDLGGCMLHITEIIIETERR